MTTEGARARLEQLEARHPATLPKKRRRLRQRLRRRMMHGMHRYEGSPSA